MFLLISDAVICAILGVKLDQAKQKKGFMVSLLNVNGKFDMILFLLLLFFFSLKALTFFRRVSSSPPTVSMNNHNTLL